MASDIKGYDESYFKQLDERYAEERKHIDSVAERFPSLDDILPSLDDILEGKDTLVGRYKQLHTQYEEIKPMLLDSMLPKLFSGAANGYVNELTYFVRMVEEVSGLTHYYEPERMLEELARQQELRIADDIVNLESKMSWGLLGGALFLPLAPFVGFGMICSSLATHFTARKMRKRLQKKAWEHPLLDTDKLFTCLWMTASIQDQRIKRLYAPGWFSTNREAFEPAYLSMDKRDQNYIEHALLKHLGAGILPGTDEIGLARYLYALKEK